MTRDDLTGFKSWFAAYCRSFYSDNIGDQRNISLKEEHTYDVCKNIAGIAKGEGLNEGDILLAEAIALFHDVGRFRQYAEYKTFRDSISVNHGLLGSVVLAEKKALAPLPEDEQELIAQAVKFHNAFSVPAIDNDRTEMFIRLVRDADKLDIWRMFFRYYETPGLDMPSAMGLGFPDTPGYSDEILSLIFKKQLVPLSILKTLNDFKLTKLSWFYDLNFRASYQLALDGDYINRIAATLPIAEDIGKAVSMLNSFAREKAKGGTGE